MTGTRALMGGMLKINYHMWKIRLGEPRNLAISPVESGKICGGKLLSLVIIVIVFTQEWQRKSESWDVERCSLQQQVESLRTQNQILADKCNVIAETSSDLRSQLERRREKLGGTEQGLKVQVTQLSTLLERSKDTISNQVRTLPYRFHGPCLYERNLLNCVDVLIYCSIAAVCGLFVYCKTLVVCGLIITVTVHCHKS